MAVTQIPSTPRKRGVREGQSTSSGLDSRHLAIRKDDQAVVVEGYFDVIALHAAASPNDGGLGSARP